MRCRGSAQKHTVFAAYLSFFRADDKMAERNIQQHIREMAYQLHFGTAIRKADDTDRPETIWRNKDGMKARWRDNIEWLIGTM